MTTTTSDEDTKHFNAIIKKMKAKHLTIEKLTELMTTTPDEDKQYLNEVIEEIKVKRPRGRPRIYTPEEVIERRREKDRKQYHQDPQKKIEANRRWRQQLKL